MFVCVSRGLEDMLICPFTPPPSDLPPSAPVLLLPAFSFPPPPPLCPLPSSPSPPFLQCADQQVEEGWEGEEGRGEGGEGRGAKAEVGEWGREHGQKQEDGRESRSGIQNG